MRFRGRLGSGITLIETIIMGAVFALVVSMVAQALVSSFRFQRRIEAKIQAVREASLAAQAIVRDLEAARTDRQVGRGPGPSFYSSNLFPSPASPATSADGLGMALRVPSGAAAPDEYVSEPLRVCYWHEQPVVDRLGEIRRAAYRRDPLTGDYIPQEGGTAGLVVARGIREFLVAGSERADGRKVVEFQIAAGDEGDPLAFFTILTPPPTLVPAP